MAALIVVSSEISSANDLGSLKLCQSYSGIPDKWRISETAGMVEIPAGSFVLGSIYGYPDERPESTLNMDGFWLDRTETTVGQFQDFVNATGYVSEAEQQGGAVVFRVPTSEELKRVDFPWWEFRKGASWRHPEGPETKAFANHPVTQITLKDAQAYASWLGRDLPTEEEWEYAAKALEAQNPDMDKEPRDQYGFPQANFWQGEFPLDNTGEDGYSGVAPVGCYQSNRFGLYDMVGNVWEQTKSRYTSRQKTSESDWEPAALRADLGMVIKGGSHLCAQNYCVRYRPSAREAHEANLPISHIGFRTVKRNSKSWIKWLSQFLLG